MQEIIVIIGKKGSGKSMTGYQLLEQITKTEKREAYIYQFPNEKALKKMPFKCKNLSHIEEVDNLTDAVVLIDEASIVFNPLEKKVNQDFRKILQISRHNNISIILIAHNTYFINRSLFSFIDRFIWKMVGLNHFETERPHIKRIFENKVKVIREINKAYVYSDDMQGYVSVPKLNWFTDEFSKAYNNKNKKTSILDLFNFKRG